MNKKELDEMFKDWTKDRNKVVISGKYEDYEKLCKKYDIRQAPNNEVFEIMIHKARAYLTKGIPKKMQKESKKWLLDNGYKLF